MLEIDKLFNIDGNFLNDEQIWIQLLPDEQYCPADSSKSPSVWADEVFREPPFQLNTMNVMLPFSFKDWLDKQRPALVNGGPIDIFGAQFETEVVKLVHQSNRLYAGTVLPYVPAKDIIKFYIWRNAA